MSLTLASTLRFALQFAVLPILARILGPTSFGLMALAMPLLILANIVSDGGLGNALVRERDSSRALESTVFWLCLASSLVLSGLICLFAAPFADLFSQQGDLAPILMASTLILPMAGALAVPNARISRERRFWVFSIGEVMASLVAAAVAIAAAMLGAGPWSLVLQQLTLWIVKLCWLMPLSGFRPDFRCRPSLVRPFLHFGLNSVGGGLANFITKNLPILLVGNLVGVAAAGHYAMAYQIVRLPELVVSGPLYLSVFASVARYGHDQSGAAELAVKGLRGLITLLAPCFCGLALVSGILVAVVLGPKWDATAPILALLAPAGFLLCLYDFLGAVLLGLGRADSQFKLIVLSGGLIVAGSVLGAHFGGEKDGVAVGFSAGAALALPAYMSTLLKQLSLSGRVVLRETIQPLVATAAMAISVVLFLRHVVHWHHLAQLSTVIPLGAAMFLLALIALSGRRLREDLHWLLGGDREVRPAWHG